MAIDITVYPNISPRIIVVDYPQTEATVQDIYDAARDWEDNGGMYYPKIVQAGGKEELGGGVLVGITATLLNAQLRFAARPAPLSSGGTITTGNTEGKILIDSGADFITDLIYPGCTAFNASTAAMETVISVDSAIQLTMFPLQAGTRQDWQVGDSYVVYPNELCQIQGGNLVAVDSADAPIDVVFQAPNINVVRSSSSAATQSDLDAIQYSSYQNAVWVDINGSIAGTEYPSGNREYPVNNLTDAVAIANEKGFATLQILASMMLDSGTVLTGFDIIGKSHVLTKLTISPSAQCANVTIKDADVVGTLDGGTHIVNCMIGDITYVNGHIHNSGLYGTITLAGGEDAALFNCGVVYVDNIPTIDMGGSGQDCVIQDYSGQFKFQNLTGSNKIAIQLDGGKIILKSTITAGTVGVNGVGTLEDEFGVEIPTGTWNGGVTVTNNLINKENITIAVWNADLSGHTIAGSTGLVLSLTEFNNQIFIDTVSGTSGTAFPQGTALHPVDNLADALTISATTAITRFHIIGNLTLTSGMDLAGYTFLASRSVGNTVTITSITNTGVCYFQDLTVSGALSGSTRFTTSVLGNITGFDGGAKNCLFTGDITITGSGANYFTDCDTYVTDATFKEISVGSNLLNIIRCRGSYRIADYTNTSAIALDFSSANVDIDGTCTAGMIIVAGMVELTDNSAAGCIVIDATLTEPGVAEKVWDADLTTHTIADSAGMILKSLSDAAIVASDTAQTGSTSTSVLTGLTQADGFYDGMMVMVKNSSGLAVRVVDEYNNTNGELILDSALPFTPILNDEVQILTARSMARTGFN